jgi:endo-1,4-beta-xylanase
MAPGPDHRHRPRWPRVAPSTQADWAARVVHICLSVPRCGSITFWGFDDGDTWLDWFIQPDTQPLLFDKSLQPKPMYTKVRDELLRGRPPSSDPGATTPSSVLFPRPVGLRPASL